MNSLLFLNNIGFEEPPHLEDLPLREIHLEKNRLRTLEGLPLNLHRLFVQANKLGASGLLFPFPECTELDVSINRIRLMENEEFITCFPSLVKLNMSTNELNHIRFLKESVIEILLVNENPIKVLDGLPSTLKSLSAEDCNIRMIQSRLPAYLESLFLSGNRLRFAGLPLHWGNSLRSLHLDYNRIEKFPRNLPDSLETLTLSNNNLEEIPAKLPSALKILILDHNKIRTCPSFPKKRFHCLHLSDNSLIQLPLNSVAQSMTLHHNWNEEEHHEAQTIIKRCWKRYVLTLRLRHFKRTHVVRQELFEVSMMPERCMQIDTINPVWFRKSPYHNHIDHH